MKTNRNELRRITETLSAEVADIILVSAKSSTYLLDCFRGTGKDLNPGSGGLYT